MPLLLCLQLRVGMCQRLPTRNCKHNATRDFHSTAVETPESHKICVKAFQRKTPPMMMTCDGCQSGPLGCGPSSAISRHSAFVLFHPYLFAICPVQSTIWRKYLGCKSFTVRSGCAACVDRRCSSQRGTPTCRRSIGRTEDTAGEPTAGAGGGISSEQRVVAMGGLSDLFALVVCVSTAHERST